MPELSNIRTKCWVVSGAPHEAWAHTGEVVRSSVSTTDSSEAASRSSAKCGSCVSRPSRIRSASYRAAPRSERAGAHASAGAPAAKLAFVWKCLGLRIRICSPPMATGAGVLLLHLLTKR